MPDTREITFMLQEILRQYGHYQRHIAVSVSGMSRTQSHIIIIVGRFKTVTLNELAEKVGLEKSWMSRVVDSMVKDGWIQKSPNPADGRSVLLSLTPKAEILHEELVTTIQAFTTEILDEMPSNTRTQLASALSGLLAALQTTQHD